MLKLLSSIEISFIHNCSFSSITISNCGLPQEYQMNKILQQNNENHANNMDARTILNEMQRSFFDATIKQRVFNYLLDKNERCYCMFLLAVYSLRWEIPASDPPILSCQRNLL